MKNEIKTKNLLPSLKTAQIDSYKKRAYETLKKYKMGSYYTITINSQNFKTEFNLERYNKDKNLDGLYVVATNVTEKRMDKTQIREHYKKLQHVEHAFRDMKTDKLNIRPIFHVNEAQTRGHVLLTMFSYAIVSRQIEQSVFPLLKEMNKKEGEQLLYKDIQAELQAIKIVELNIGKANKSLQITKLSKHQKIIFKSLNIKENELIKMAV